MRFFFPHASVTLPRFLGPNTSLRNVSFNTLILYIYSNLNWDANWHPWETMINDTLHRSLYKFVGVGCKNIRAEEMLIFDLFAAVYANIPFFQDMRLISKLLNTYLAGSRSWRAWMNLNVIPKASRWWYGHPCRTAFDRGARKGQRYPEPPGWRLSLSLTFSPRKNLTVSKSW